VGKRSSHTPVIASLLVVVIGTACAAFLAGHQASSNSSPTRIVPLSTIFVTGQTGVPAVEVALGSEHPVKVLLDTGSVGLRIYSSALPLHTGDGISVTHRHDSVRFGDGTRFSGSVAMAKVRIDGLSTVKAIPFQRVTSHTCTAGPECQGYRADNVFGVMGIGLVDHGPPMEEVNPLAALPGTYGHSWRIRVGSPITATSSGVLELGAPIPDSGTIFALEASAHGGWNDMLNVCWSVGNKVRVQLPTLFDTGSWVARLRSKSLSPVLAPKLTPQYAPDSLEMRLSKCPSTNPFLTFSANQDLNPVVLYPSGAPLAVVGAPVFYSLEFTYDVQKGEIAVTPSPSALVPQ
jgi:Protein of unknown function (DUF3443)